MFERTGGSGASRVDEGGVKGLGAKEDADAGIISQVTALRPAKLSKLQ